jgi:DNA repair protein RAD5
VDLQVLDFSRPERQIYKHLEERAKRRFIQLDAEGRAMSNYTSILAMLMKYVNHPIVIAVVIDELIGRLRQCVDHPLLVLSKVTEEDGTDDKLLDADGSSADQTGSLRDMIAKYAGAAGKKAIAATNGSHAKEEDVEGVAGDDQDGDGAYALKVLKEIEEADGTSECMICTSEIFDEVLLPCYHRG